MSLFVSESNNMPHKSEDERKKYAAEYYRKNKNRLDNYKKQWKYENPEKAKQHSKTYNDKTVDKRKWSVVKYRYGLSKQDFFALLEQQDTCCALCAKSFYDKKIFIDHCHLTGSVRGLLCPSCNTALGLIGDDLLWLAKAKKYLTEKK